ncbi:MAG TPA: immunoglobulin-like domain-containing protein, partial [Patescibacteria group bacterium]
PVITLKGNSALSISSGAIYKDYGATALDETDGDITSKIKVTGDVNTSVPGKYTITYAVSDSSGNEAVPVTRTITVTSNIISVNYGDLNDDGKVNSLDVSILKKIILELYTGSYDTINADMNGDTKINSLDYSLLKKKILEN